MAQSHIIKDTSKMINHPTKGWILKEPGKIPVVLFTVETVGNNTQLRLPNGSTQEIDNKVITIGENGQYKVLDSLPSKSREQVLAESNATAVRYAQQQIDKVEKQSGEKFPSITTRNIGQ